METKPIYIYIYILYLLLQVSDGCRHQFIVQILKTAPGQINVTVFLLTLTIVDTNRRTRPAMCRRMIPSSRSSIFSGDLDSNEKRSESLSVCVCVWGRWDMGVSLRRLQTGQRFRETSSQSDGKHLHEPQRLVYLEHSETFIGKFGATNTSLHQLRPLSNIVSFFFFLKSAFKCLVCVISRMEIISVKNVDPAKKTSV